MRRGFVTGAIGLAACVAACATTGAGGCAANSAHSTMSHSTNSSAPNDAATTPQDKAHEDQLTAMGRQDAQSAQASTKKIKPRQTSRSRRRKGQGIVDQPIRR